MKTFARILTSLKVAFSCELFIKLYDFIDICVRVLTGISSAHCIRVAAKADGSGIDVHYKDNFDEEHNRFPRPAPAVRSAIYQRLFCHRDDPTRQGYPQNPLEVSYLSERYALKLMSIIAHHYYLNCIVFCYAGDNDESNAHSFAAWVQLLLVAKEGMATVMYNPMSFSTVRHQYQ